MEQLSMLVEHDDPHAAPAQASAELLRAQLKPNQLPGLQPSAKGARGDHLVPRACFPTNTFRYLPSNLPGEYTRLVSMGFPLHSLAATQKPKQHLRSGNTLKRKLGIVTSLQASQYRAGVYLGLLWGFLLLQGSFQALGSCRHLADAVCVAGSEAQ